VNRLAPLGFLLLVAMVFLLPPAKALAVESAAVTLDGLEPALTKDGDGDAKVIVNLTNNTDAPAEVEASAAGATGCLLGLGPKQLPAEVKTTVTILVPASCKAEKGFTIGLETSVGGAASQAFQLTPKVKEADEKDWSPLWICFLGAFGAVALALFVFYVTSWKEGPGAERKLGQPLPSLDDTWKFNDNWATNVTAVGALLSGIFGATIGKAFLGENAESELALAIVGAGVAAVLVGVAPIIALGTKSYKPPKKPDPKPPEETPTTQEEISEEPERGDAFTVGGVVFAAAAVTTGAVGQLVIVTHVGTQVLGGSDWPLYLAGAVLIVLLGLYSWRSLADVLERGTTPAKDSPAVEVTAAKIVAKAIEGASGEGCTKTRAAAEIRSAIASNELAAAEPYRRRPRSALI